MDNASPLLAMLFVVGSACSSVIASLVAERVLKEECLPFHIQKVRLDIGSALVSMVLFPVIGFISSRPQDAYWKDRPLHKTAACVAELQPCWQQYGTCSATCKGSDSCCDHGVWVGWDNWLVILALAITVLQGWLTGVVIKQFSTVLRAIAQASTLLAIYFIGDPLLNPARVENIPLTLVAFAIPLSTIVFNVAVSEMEKVTKLITASFCAEAASTRQSPTTTPDTSLSQSRPPQRAQSASCNPEDGGPDGGRTRTDLEEPVFQSSLQVDGNTSSTDTSIRSRPET